MKKSAITIRLSLLCGQYLSRRWSDSDGILGGEQARPLWCDQYMRAAAEQLAPQFCSVLLDPPMALPVFLHLPRSLLRFVAQNGKKGRVQTAAADARNSA